MENKNLKTKSKKGVVKKKTTRKNKTKKKAFTLIELLAVIIILGILLIIAVPAVTKYINGSKNSSYVTTVKQLISGARNLVNDGKYELFDTKTTYYIDTRCIKTENANKSPYGEFEKSYVLVTYNGKGYTYYWTGVDNKRKGSKAIIKADLLKEEDIKTNIKKDEIIENAGIDNDTNYVLIDENCVKREPQTDVMKINSVSGTNIYALVVDHYGKPSGYVGDIVELFAEVHGLEDCDYDLIWIYTTDGTNWIDVTGNESWYNEVPDKHYLRFTLDTTTVAHTWKFKIINVKRK